MARLPPLSAGPALSHFNLRRRNLVVRLTKVSPDKIERDGFDARGDNTHELQLSTSNWARRNQPVLRALTMALLGAGAMGFVAPADKGPMCSAAPYNVFHLVAGGVGLRIAMTKNARVASWFNLTFGLIDLYQALAGVSGIFPSRLFRLRPADHVVHLVLGVVLAFVGWRGLSSGPQTDARES